MTIDTDIANRALSAMGARSTIASFTEKSKEAREVLLVYAPTRDALLRSAHWNFARAAAYLTILKAAPGTVENPAAPASTGWQPSYPQPPWRYSYAVPADCVKLRYVSPQINTGSTFGTPIFSVPSTTPAPLHEFRPVRFLVATDTDILGNPASVVLCNQDQAIGIYTRRIVNPQLWDGLFQEAMVSALASRLVIPLAGDKAMKKMLAQEAMSNVTAARVSDGNEGTTIQEHIPDWIRVRGFAGDWSTTVGFGGWETPSFLML